MKTLHLSIIAIIIGSSIILSSLLILQMQQNSLDFKEFEIINLNQTYKQGDLVTISVKYDGEKFGCHFPKIEVTNKTNTGQVFASIGEEQITNGECPNSWSLAFYPGFENEAAQSIPSEKGLSYIASATLGGKTIQKEFTIYPDPDRKFFTDIQVIDTVKVHHVNDILNFMIAVRAYGVLDAGQEPEVQVMDGHNSTIWNSQNNIVLCCPIELTQVSRDIPLSNLGESLKIDSAGTYTMLVIYAGKKIQKTFDVILPETPCNQVSNDNSKIDLKKYTWIAVSEIKQPFKGGCIDVDKILPENVILEQAIQGADGCQNGTIQCTIPKGVGLATFLDGGLSASDSDQYKQSLSKDDAKLLAKELGFTMLKEAAYKVLKHDDKYYLLLFYTTDESAGAEAVMEFEKPIGYDPVRLEKGTSLNYTIYVKTLATFGAPGDVKLYAGIPARDSLVSVTLEPSNLTIQERSQENTTLTITASKDARDGIYNMVLYGKSGEGLIGPYNHMNLPMIQIGDSIWNIRTYGQESSAGIGGYKPLENTWAELELNKDEFDNGDLVEIKAYLVNNSTKKIIMEDESRLYVQVIKTSDLGYYDNLYGIEAISGHDKQIVLEPFSRTLLVRPFYWDQDTSFGDGHSERLEPKKYKMLMSFGSYNGTVWDDEAWFEIK